MVSENIRVELDYYYNEESHHKRMGLYRISYINYEQKMLVTLKLNVVKVDISLFYKFHDRVIRFYKI